MLHLLLLLTVSLYLTQAQIQSPNRLFAVTSPSPNSPYITGQMLPCIYLIASNATSETLQLAISLELGNMSILLIDRADISPGFSYERQLGQSTVYEHQFNYNLPINMATGVYQVKFTDRISLSEVSIPVRISAATITSVNSKTPTGPAALPGSSLTSIYNMNAAYQYNVPIVMIVLMSILSLQILMK
ncbi:hypothetical protein BDB01DRAFT_848103 [Pilobolus umbonatus]|nr:hypothetical protein BDB01DRAFT_848103 [Pilobolus umbonatus]